MSDAEIGSGAAGVVSHVAGQDTTAGTSVAGAAPSGGAIDGAARPDMPGNGGLDDAGETVADDVPPEEGLSGDGDSLTGVTDAASDDEPASGS
ncbi:hypothetical protein [Amnibacterium sp.]|uniref:hypothetical protein n=1 Tax=Amnibacterium sp. TaxID=1872496 RepID=UPI00261A6054|nr:hypothetical protein [Amnibacterium sp.]MCU1473771.1 hypothetical protein [Amnibacterium sp.]